VEVAAELFASKGYGQTGLDEIAEEAGLTKGAVYSNFTSKADLALAVLDELALGPALEIFSQVDAGERFDDQHLHGGKLLVEVMDASSLWFQVELQCALQAGRDEELRNRLLARDAALRSTLSASIAGRMQKAGWAPTVDMGVIVAALTAVASGIALQRLKDPNSVPAEMTGQLITAIYRQFAEPTGDTGMIG
jgi:AcrR family transcriptional regulator